MSSLMEARPFLLFHALDLTSEFAAEAISRIRRAVICQLTHLPMSLHNDQYQSFTEHNGQT
ncbi:hypothetical protein ACJMK2_019444, partial [Sinanodonta woodiana]